MVMRFKEPVIVIPALECLPETKPRNRPWTKEEIEILLHYYPIRDHAAVAKFLGRSKVACDQAMDRFKKD
jgi:hypothetical protein